MGETEKRELRSVLSDNLSETENRKDLSLLISSISETERRYLLKKLVNWHHSKSIELREYSRIPFSIPVEYSTNGIRFIYFIQNISDDGVFIQTECIHLFEYVTDITVELLHALDISTAVWRGVLCVCSTWIR